MVEILVKEAAAKQYPETISFLLSGIHYVLEQVVNLTVLPVEQILIWPRLPSRACYRNRRWCYTPSNRIIFGAENTCFSADYRGYKYKKFGGVKDLSPQGVFCHELGHALEEVAFGIHGKFEAALRANEKPITWYGGTNTNEDIAEATRLYLSNPMKLMELHPRRFEILYEYDLEIQYSRAISGNSDPSLW